MPYVGHSVDITISVCILLGVVWLNMAESVLDWSDESAIHPSEARSPILMELYRDLVPTYGLEGLHGICKRVYRVLQTTTLQTAEQCRRQHDSRQAKLSDVTEFYNTLIESERFNRTLEFPLADQFKRFSFRATFAYLASKGNEPAVMFEIASQSNQVVCVQSISCPKTTTTITTTTSATKAPSIVVVDLSKDTVMKSETGSTERLQTQLISPTASDSLIRPDGSGSPFWNTLLSGTESKSWFLATISLSCLCFILIIILLSTWLYVFRLRRLYSRRRCRGTCRFGCRCPSEVIRQTINSAAVCGPLDLQNAHLFGSPLTPQGNGSIRSGSGFGPTFYPGGGTMTSSRWGSNGCQKINSPLYVSLANAPDKASLLAPLVNCPIQAPIPNVGTPNLSVNVSHIDWSQSNDHHLLAHANNRRRPSQDAIYRSLSDGSSVTSHPPQNGGSKIIRSGLTVGFAGNTSIHTPVNGNNIVDISSAATNVILPSMLVSKVSASHLLDSCGPGYYQTSFANNYSYQDGTRNDNVSPIHSQSPTRMITNNHLADRTYLISSGVMTERGLKENVGHTFLHSQANKVHDQGGAFNSCDPGSFQQMNLYPIRGSDGDVLNITPPSGFFDQHAIVTNSEMVNGSFTLSMMGSANRNKTNYPCNPPGYSALNGPIDQTDWTSQPIPDSAYSNGAMVGVVDVEPLTRVSPTERITLSPNQLTFKPNEMVARTTGFALPTANNKMLSPRVYATSEQML